VTCAMPGGTTTGCIAALLLTTDALVAEEVQGVTGAIMAPGFGDLAEGLPRPSSDAATPSL
jgi:hypothetical protein